MNLHTAIKESRGRKPWVRRMRIEERGAIKELCKGNILWTEHFEKKHHHNWIDRALLKMREGQVVFGAFGALKDADQAGEKYGLIGCIFLKRTEYHSSAELKCLSISSRTGDSSPDPRSIARALIYKAVDFAESNQIDAIEMEVPQDFKDLISLCIELEFYVASIRQKYRPGKFDCVLERLTGRSYRGDPYNYAKIGAWVCRAILTSKITGYYHDPDDAALGYIEFEPSPQRPPFSKDNRVGYEKRIRGCLATTGYSGTKDLAKRTCELFKPEHLIRVVVCKSLNTEAKEVYNAGRVLIIDREELKAIAGGDASTLSIPVVLDKVGGVVTVLEREDIRELANQKEFVYYLLSGTGESLCSIDNGYLVIGAPGWDSGTDGLGIVGFAQIKRSIPKEVAEVYKFFPGKHKALTKEKIDIYAASLPAEERAVAILCGPLKLFKESLPISKGAKWIPNSNVADYLWRELVDRSANSCYIDSEACISISKYGTRSKTMKIDTATAHRYRVAISYAGEDRPRVMPVARALAKRYGKDRIFYDEFHRSYLLGKNLDERLVKAYSDAELVVVFLSRDYPKKNWCGLEWAVVRDIFFTRKREHCVLVFKDKAAKPMIGWGLRDGYAQFDSAKTRQLVSDIVQKLETISP
jgi:hypothetical protein